MMSPCVGFAYVKVSTSITNHLQSHIVWLSPETYQETFFLEKKAQIPSRMSIRL